MVDKIGATEDFLALPVFLKGTVFTKRRIKYKVVPKSVKENIVNQLKTNPFAIFRLSVELGCSKRNIKNWVKKFKQPPLKN